MDPYRSNRLAAAIQRLLGDLLATRVKDPRVQMVAISQVELNRDHSQARVFVAVTGNDEERGQALVGLRKAAGFLQREVGAGLRLRQVPTLIFAEDDSLDRGFGVEQVLRELAARGEFLDETERRRRLRHADLEPPRELVEPLLAAERVWLTGHWSPDPDCAGAMLALAAVLRELDKDVVAFSFPDPPPGLAELPGWPQTVPSGEAPALLQAAPPDLALLVDCHRTERCGDLQETLDRLPVKLCLDHHLVSGRRAPLSGWVEPRAESTCTLAFRLIEVLGAGREGLLDAEVATNLFAGLAGDTGGFRFNNVGPATFHLAGDLAALGVDTAEVQHRLLHQRTRAGLALLHRALDSLVYAGDGSVALLQIDAAMFAASGASPAESEGLVNLLTAVEGVRYAAVIKELEPRVWRVSLRSRDGDVQQVAAAFGGGGHRAAAGCTIEGAAAEVQAQVLAALREAE
jgi:bifunctional oligoribonuclease and PAP phosphatase NrnA